jgi:hypothetical protein
MAENSRNCKTWCVSLVSALLVFSSKTLALPWFVLLLPILPLMYLDMYYLALEGFYIKAYDTLIASQLCGTLTEHNVYELEKPNGNLNIFYQFRSKSVWPFYGALGLVAAAVGYFMAIQSVCCKI